MRLVTRSDFDGLMCAVLLKEVEDISEILFAHPKSVQDGSVHITSNDILTNLPYDPNCGKWFDHHSSEEERIDIEEECFEGHLEMAPSTARVVYNYYIDRGVHELMKYEEVLEAVDKVDSAQFDKNDILKPQGWVLLSFLMDPRSGFGRYHHFRISNYQLMLKLIEWMQKYTIEEILELPDVKERIDLYLQHQKDFEHMIRKHSEQHENVLVTDLRSVNEIYTGNRFLVYTLFPEANVSIRIFNGFRDQNYVVAVGHNIFNQTCRIDIGDLMSNYGGGGHFGAGTCQLDVKNADEMLNEIITELKSID